MILCELKWTVLMLHYGQVQNGLVAVPDVFISLKCAVEHAINSLSERYELYSHTCLFVWNALKCCC